MDRVRSEKAGQSLDLGPWASSGYSRARSIGSALAQLNAEPQALEKERIATAAGTTMRLVYSTFETSGR